MFDVSALFVSAAHAADAALPAASAVGEEPSVWIRFMPLFLIFFVFYILLIRPQQKKLDEQASLLKNLKKGDKIVTSGGVVGTIAKVEGEKYLMVEIAKDVQVKIVRAMVSHLAKDEDEKKKD